MLENSTIAKQTSDDYNNSTSWYGLQIFEEKPQELKTYGIFLRYTSRSGIHNMYKEYRNTTLTSAVGQLCKWNSICYTLLFSVSVSQSSNVETLFFPSHCTIYCLVCRLRNGLSSPRPKPQYPNHPHLHCGGWRLQAWEHASVLGTILVCGCLRVRATRSWWPIYWLLCRPDSLQGDDVKFPLPKRRPRPSKRNKSTFLATRPRTFCY